MVRLKSTQRGSGATVEVSRIYANGPTEYVTLFFDSGMGDRFGVEVRADQLVAAVTDARHGRPASSETTHPQEETDD